MRTLFTAILVAGFGVTALGQEPKPTDSKLKVGDPAPALKATKWLQGAEVKEFAKDQVYVVEFWATWCGPCIVMMPHMGELQKQYEGKATFVGFSAKDPNNTQEKVTAMVEKRGPKLGYTFAYADDRTTYEAWMKAAGQNGIPCCFVVGKDGKIAYIGHPMYLDIILPKVVSGTWKTDDVAELAKVEKDVNAVFGSLNNPDTDAGIKAITEFESKHPQLAQIPYFIGPKINLFVKAKKFDEAKMMAEEVLAKAAKQEDPTAIRTVASVLSSPDAKGNKDLAALALKAADAGLKVAGENDLFALVTAANVYYAAGEKAKAQELGKKALAAADKESPAMKRQVEALIKKFDE